MIIHPSCGQIAPKFQAALERLATHLPPGRSLPYRSHLGSFFIARDRYRRLLLTTAPNEAFPIVSTAPPDMAKVGPQIWGHFHHAALVLESPADRLALVESIPLMLPCGDCRTHWKAWVQAHPPRVETAAEFFAWSVDSHNAVSARLGKWEMGLPDALALYAAK